MKKNNYILGAGVTGLAAGMASGLPILEAADHSGGICSSYYMREGDAQRRLSPPKNEEAYRFELGGGHWIFGADPLMLNLIQSLSPVKQYQRRSSVYFADKKKYVPYPLQQHLDYLDPEIKKGAFTELSTAVPRGRTMKQWVCTSFGKTLSDLFFGPFHEAYTAGLYGKISPQDGYKTPVKLKQVSRGAARTHRESAGYNVTFVYPENGLNALTQRMARECDIRYGHRVDRISLKRKEIVCSNGRKMSYQKLISTLPLFQTIQMCGLKTKALADPYTSVLVLNIGAERGKHCPKDHWVYVPKSKSGFHRVGMYSNVDSSFLPKEYRKKKSVVSLYVERSFSGGAKPTAAEIKTYSNSVLRELQSWGYIKTCHVVDPTWIEVAYTWSWPNSQWRTEAIRVLESHQIYPVGRYARWKFQGIAESIRDGLVAGASFKKSR